METYGPLGLSASVGALLGAIFTAGFPPPLALPTEPVDAAPSESDLIKAEIALCGGILGALALQLVHCGRRSQDMASSSLQRPLLGGGHVKTRGKVVSQPADSRDRTLAGISEANRVCELLSLASLRPPPKIVECIRVCQPLVEALIMGMRLVAPVFFAFYKFLYFLYCVVPTNELKMIYGAALCFFGGKYCASIAAVECFRRTGGDKLLICLKELGANAQAAYQASVEDDKIDDDSDGIADVKQISTQDWYKRKLGVVLRSVDPDVLAQAVAGLYQGFIGMVMSLKFKFAWTVALSCSIADNLRKPVSIVAVPVLAALMPKEYHKWITQIINFTLKAFAMHMAWKLQMVISAVQSGLLGASLVGTGVVVIMFRCCGKKDKFDADSTYIDEAIGLPLACAGIWFQLSHGFSLPFPLNIALLPLTVVEEILRFCITWFPVTDTLAMTPA